MVSLKNLHVIAVVSNPLLFKSRYNLYNIFSEDIERKGARLWTLELQIGARSHLVTSGEHPQHIQLSTSALSGDLWYKENLINLALQHIVAYVPNDVRYVAWVDADVKFEIGMLEKTIDALQRYDIVQMWSHAVDFGPNQETLGIPQLSFMYCYKHGISIKGNSGYNQGGHPGYAWAARRDALNKLGAAGQGPLVDWAILGSADRHMAWAWVGGVEKSLYPGMHHVYDDWLLAYQQRAHVGIRQNVSYVTGTIRHMWHGKKKSRNYDNRWKILVKNQYNPITDIRKDVSGVLNLVDDTPRQRALRDDMRKYFECRLEDSIDII